MVGLVQHLQNKITALLVICQKLLVFLAQSQTNNCSVISPNAAYVHDLKHKNLVFTWLFIFNVLFSTLLPKKLLTALTTCFLLTLQSLLWLSL